MTRKSLWSMLAVIITVVVPTGADTFKNKESGEVFYGFCTQKSTANKTLVYNTTAEKFISIDVRDYEITMDYNGRHNSVVVVPITDPEVFLSETIAKTVAEAVVKASNTGPKFVLLKIDNPGGRGEYMKELCMAISQTNNCKVVAYICSGPYSGAHSAAVIPALACEKVFIAPTASISAISPFVKATSNEEFVQTYSSESLASFSVFAATLAQTKHRPALLTKALLDKRLALAEVIDSNGKHDVVEKDLRQSSQTIVKSLCDGLPSSQEQDKTGLPPDIHNRVLNLTPTEAVQLRLADKIVNSIQDVLVEMNAEDAQIANAPGIESIIKQFIAARKNVRQNLSRIEFLEERTATLEAQLNTVEEQIRTTPTTRTQTQYENRANQRGHVYLSEGTVYSDREFRSPENPNTQDSARQSNQRRTDSRRINTAQTVTSAEPSVAVEQIRVELSYVLGDLISEYRKTITSAKRWVGVLPTGITIQTLEKNMNSAMALANNLRYRPLGNNNP